MSATNGNGTRAVNVWAAASVCSTIVLALCGAFGSSYVRDQSRIEHAVRLLEDQREESAYHRGRTDERLDTLAGLAATNREAIRTGLAALDEMLQRETRLVNGETAARLDETDRRLQQEMRTLFDANRERIGTLEGLAEEAAASRWSRADQERFEDQLGLGLSSRAALSGATRP